MSKWIVVPVLSCWLAGCGIGLMTSSLVAAPAVPSMRERLQEQSIPYIAQYYWPGHLNEQLTEELFEEYLRMGFTGIQKAEQDSFRGARMFVEHGLHGFMWQTYWQMPDPQLDKEGKALEPGVYGCLSSDRNVTAGIDTILKYIEDHGPDLYKVGGRYVFTSWDETGIQYSSYCQCPLCAKLFREYLQAEVYHDDSPAQDSNGDSKTLNADASTAHERWDDIPLAQFADRFDQPVLWKYFVDFTAWKMARFFGLVEEGVNQGGQPMDYMTFYHSTMYWPGMGPQQGTTPYYHAQQSAILANEFCIADWPVATIASSWNDRLSRDYGRGVYDYSWFWYGYKGGEDYFVHNKWEYERALARKMGHTLHGLLFWVYAMPIYVHLPEQSAEIAYWHHFLQKHWEFLKKAEPSRAQIAVLWPGHSSGFYEHVRYPKTDFGWGPQALIEGQYPFTVVQEEEVEAGILKDYKLVYVFGVERTTAKVLAEIDKFIDRGGYVFSDADSLLMTIDGKRSDLLAQRFGVDLKKKYKSVYWPTVLSAEEDAWAQVADPLWGKGQYAVADTPPLPARTPTGLVQTRLDPEQAQIMSVSPSIVPFRQVRTYHDIVTGVAANGGRVLGTYQGEPVAVTTARTVWFGNRPGWDMYATFPKDILAAWGEPMYNNGQTPGWYDSSGAAERTDYRRIITYVAAKAKIQRPAVVTRGGRLAPHIEVAVKTLSSTGAMMVFLINHEDIGGKHEVIVKHVPDTFEAWDVMNDQLIEKNSDGRVELDLLPWRARVVYFGPPDQARYISRKQRELLALDLSPVKFTVGPKTLSEPPLPEVGVAPQPRPASLGAGEVAQLTVTATNSDDRQPRLGEPIIIPASALARYLRTLTVRGVRLASGAAVQWDDLDGDSVLSRADEIVWQTDLAPGEKKTFTLILLEQPAPRAAPEGFALSADQETAKVQVGGEDLFIVGKDNSWQFPSAQTGQPVKHPGARCFAGDEVRDPRIEILGDGPVRKLIEVSHGYEPYQEYLSEDLQPEANTTAHYAVYAQQVPGEHRVYVDVRHAINKDFIAGKKPLAAGYSPAGRLAGLEGYYSGWYKDTLGRVGPLFHHKMERNCGGWLAVSQGKDQVLGLMARRTTGIVAPRPVPDEADGIQIILALMTRSEMNWDASDLRGVVDGEILAGNVFHLEALVALKDGSGWQGIDELRRQYASPPTVTIVQWKLARRTQ